MAALLDTYENWNKNGFYVNKGSKAVEFRDEKAYFSEDQVTPKQNQRDFITAKTVHGNAHAVLQRIGDMSDIEPCEYTPPLSCKDEEPERRYYADGSCDVMFGGPCGPLHLDRNGES